MGTGASSSEVAAARLEGVSDLQIERYKLARGLLRRLKEQKTIVSKPIRSHIDRTPSGQRGVSIAFVRAFVDHVCDYGNTEAEMRQICKDGEASVCSLTASTGLSLMESCAMLLLDADDQCTAGIFAPATAFFSYSWMGTSLVDMFGSLMALEPELPLETTYFWIDVFAVSQNLLDGKYDGYKENTNQIFSDALDTTNHVVLYASPLIGEWQSPQHPFLSVEREGQGAPPDPWLRKGPRSITRAWCLFEVTESLLKKHRFHVALSPSDSKELETLLVKRFNEVITIFSEVNADDAQVSKIRDRAFICGRIDQLPKTYESINNSVKGGLWGWLVDASGVIEERLQKVGAGDEDKRKWGYRLALLKNGRGRLLEQLARFEAADVAFREAIALYKEHGAEKDVAITLNNLAKLLKKQGKLHEAKPKYEQAIAILKKMDGEEPYQFLATAFNNLAQLLNAQDKPDEAEPLYEQSLAIRKKLYGEEHPKVAIALNNLAAFWKVQGKLDKAEEPLRRAIVIWKKVHGVEHPHVASGLNNLAQLLQTQGKLDEAEPLQKQALAIDRKFYGEDHLYVAGDLNNLASLLKKRNDSSSEAVCLGKQALAIAEKILGAEHPKTKAYRKSWS